MNEASAVPPVEPLRDSSLAELEEMLPLLRRQRRNGLAGLYLGDRVAGFYWDRLCIGNVRDPALIGESHFGPEGREKLASQLGSGCEIPYASIRKIVVERPSLRRDICRFRIDAESRRCSITLPARDVGNVLQYLRAVVGNRLVVARWIRPRGWGMGVLLTMVLGLIVFLGRSVPGSVMLIGFLSVLAALLAVVLICDHIPVRLPEEKSATVGKRPSVDKSGRAPFRSKPLGWVVKCACAAWLFALYLFGAHIFSVAGGWLIARGIVSADMWSILLLFLCALGYGAGLLGLYGGYLLTQLPPDFVQAEDSRQPILYLRSFADDRTTSLLQKSQLGYYLGVQPQEFVPTPWRYVFMFHPIRVLRILFGIGADTSEEQIGLYLRSRGPFVAIGKPGERFASPGASRIYVTNEEWKQTVLDLAKQSQLIVLQPAATEGVWWEVEQALERVALPRILFCMINFYDRPNDYELFCRRVRKHSGRPFPRSVSFTRRPAFIFFDAAGKACLQEVSYRSPLSWPLLGNAIDLNYTLDPYVKSLDQNTPLESRPVKRHVGHATAAVCLFLIAPLVAASLAQSDWRRWIGLGPPAAQAVAASGPAIRLPQTVAINYNNVGISLQSEGKHQEAIEQFNKALALGDHSAIIYANRGASCQALGNYADAVRDYTKGIEQSPQFAELYSLRGQCLLEQKDLNNAVLNLNTAIKLKPDFPMAYFYRGAVFVQANLQDRSIADFTKAIELSPKLILAYKARGNVFSHAGEFQKAIDDYSKAIELKADDAVAIENRANALAELNRLSEAAADYAVAEKLIPSNPDSLLFLAYLDPWLGNSEAERGDRRRLAALVLTPKNAVADSPLVWIQLTSFGIELDWAPLVPIAQANAKANPKRTDFGVIYGAALFRAGRYAEARDELEAAQRLAGEQTFALLDLFAGLNSVRLHQIDVASKSLARARAWIDANAPKIATRGHPVNGPHWFQRLAMHHLLAELDREIAGGSGEKPVN